MFVSVMLRFEACEYCLLSLAAACKVSSVFHLVADPCLITLQFVIFLVSVTFIQSGWAADFITSVPVMPAFMFPYKRMTPISSTQASIQIL